MALQRDKLAVVAFAVFIAAVALFAPSAPNQSGKARSVTSPAPEGRAALFLLLRELRFAPEIWRQRPGTLPAGAHLLWMPELPPARGLFEDDVLHKRGARKTADAPPADPAPPDAPAAKEGEQAELDELDPWRAALEHGLRGPRNYRRFVQNGGTLVIAVDVLSLHRLRTEFEFNELEGLELQDLEPAAADQGDVLSVQYLYDEQLQIQWPDRRCFTTRDLAAHWNPLVTTERNEVLALEVGVARGELILLAEDHFLDNKNIGEHDHGVLAARLAERDRPGGRLLFDEYSLGAWHAESAFEMAFFGRAKLLTLHLLVLLCLCAWHLAWVREFPRDPEPLATASPLLRARAQAALYIRARRFDLLARDLRVAVLRRITTRLKLARGEPDEAEAALVDRLARAAGKEQEIERWRALFLTRKVESADELERLEAELAALEIELSERTAVARGARGRQAAST